jgi:type I restriction enzyme S subunit
MKSNLKRLGDYIKLVDVRNHDLAVSYLRGIATSKQLIESNANMTGVSLSNYKVVKPSQFAYTSDTSRRGEKIALAYNNNETCIVSSIYTVFEVVDKNQLIPEYLFLWFQRPEFDRYARFHSWGSARETFDWQDMCEVRIPIPGIDVQRKYVALYSALLKNQQAYEKSLADLQLICDSFLEDLKNKLPHKRLGEYIQQSDERNRRLDVSRLRGISTEKVLIQSKANMNGVNSAGYKIVGSRQFVYTPDTSRRGDKMALAFNAEEQCIVSSIYTVFEIVKADELMPEYLYLWFKRTEFDRYARFHSWGSARETFDWSDMCEVKLPVPDIEVQESIVAIHHTLETRKRLNIELKTQIQNLCPILMRSVVENISKEFS